MLIGSRADGRINTNDLTWVARYWAGEPFNDCPVWELLANGVALILDKDVRRRCFELVKRVFPESHIPILMARLASEAGTHGGLITPFLLSENDQHVRLEYLWSDAEFRDPTVIEKIAAHPDCGFLPRLMAENEVWKNTRLQSMGTRLSVRCMNTTRPTTP